MGRIRSLDLEPGKWYADSREGDKTSFLRFNGTLTGLLCFDFMTGFESAYPLIDGYYKFKQDPESWWFKPDFEDIEKWDLL